MERLCDLDQLAGVAREDFRVELSDGRNAHDLHPRLVLVEDVEHLLLVDALLQPRRIGPQRQGDEEAVVIGVQVELRSVTRRRGQGSVEITRQGVDRINFAV